MGTSAFGFGGKDADGNNTGFNWGDMLGQAGGVAASGLQGLFPQSQNGTSNTQTNQSGSSAQTSSGTTSQLLNSLASLFGSSTGTSTTSNAFGDQGNALLASMAPLLQKTATPFDKQAYIGNAGNNINAGAMAQQKNLAQSMAARGLGSSPASAIANAGIDASRIGQQVQVQNSVPQAEQTYNNAQLAPLTNLLSLMPKNSITNTDQTQQQQSNSQQTGSGSTYGTSNGTTSSTGTQDTQTTSKPSGGFSGLLNGVGSALGALFGF